MGTMTPQELLRLWTLDKITLETAMGHVLQNLVQLQATSETRGRSLVKLQARLDKLINQTNKQQQTIEGHSLTLYRLRADLDTLTAQSGLEPPEKT
jgi:hypothetical protein